MWKRTVAGTAALIAIGALVATSTTASGQSPRVHRARPTMPDTTLVNAAGAYVISVVEGAQLEAALLDWEGNAVLGDWLGAQAANDAVRAAAARSVPPSPARPGVSSPQSGASTGACGGATNGADQFIARESGGNPGIYNAGGSGAWGCYQVMPGTWASSCSDIGTFGSATPAQQAQCASRLPLSAWGG